MTMLPSRSLKTSSWLKGLVKKKKNSVTSTTSSGHNTSSTRTSSQGATSASSGRPISNGPLLAAHNGPAWNSNHWKRAIEKAKTRLDEDEKETFQQFSSKDSLSAAIHYTDGVYNEAKNRQWIRTDRIHRILNSLQSFAKVGDICIQHSPEVTSLVWGSVRFLLQVRYFFHYREQPRV